MVPLAKILVKSERLEAGQKKAVLVHLAYILVERVSWENGQ